MSDAIVLDRRLTETAYNFRSGQTNFCNLCNLRQSVESSSGALSQTITAMHRRNSFLEKRALAEVRQVYVDLAQRPLERNCLRQTECCHFKLTGRTPYLTKGEAIMAARALRATGRKSLPENPDGACPMLQSVTGNCLIYNDRPFGCRTHFCAAAGGPIARREVVDLIRRLERIDVELDGTGPRTFENAVAKALERSRHR